MFLKNTNCKAMYKKMSVNDQINILDRKIMQNEEQYGLNRKAAKTSALPSNNLDKYEYSPLGKIFTKGLSEMIKKDFLRG